jgi:hypothetical protein
MSSRGLRDVGVEPASTTIRCTVAASNASSCRQQRTWAAARGMSGRVKVIGCMMVSGYVAVDSAAYRCQQPAHNIDVQKGRARSSSGCCRCFPTLAAGIRAELYRNDRRALRRAAVPSSVPTPRSGELPPSSSHICIGLLLSTGQDLCSPQISDRIPSCKPMRAHYDRFSRCLPGLHQVGTK